jgi:hypothetical protein
VQFFFRQLIAEIDFREMLDETGRQVTSVAVFDLAKPADGRKFRKLIHSDFFVGQAILLGRV